MRLVIDFLIRACWIQCQLLDALTSAQEITDKGFCSTKGLYYYGMKLHTLVCCRKGRPPHPEQI